MTKAKFDLYWMTNDNWFKFDEDGKPFLTSEAPPEAVKSFENYKKQLIEKKDVI